MKDENTLRDTISSYVYTRFADYITGNSIVYGKAMFTLDMLIEGSIDTCKLNPEKDIRYIVDYMFDYYCT